MAEVLLKDPSKDERWVKFCVCDDQFPSEADLLSFQARFCRGDDTKIIVQVWQQLSCKLLLDAAIKRHQTGFVLSTGLHLLLTHSNAHSKSVHLPQGIVITGSKHDAFADDPWIVKLRQYMRQEADRGQRILGICFGAQLLAVSLGGKAGLAI